jgi:transcriptional regulator with XRE-family HTH domain
MYGSKLRAIRHLRDYTQEYVAQKAGIKQNVYCQIEKDEIVKLPTTTLEKIAEALNVTIEDIKNPMPLVVSLNKNIEPNLPTQSGNNITSEIIQELTRQLQAKDAQINKLLEIITIPPGNSKSL